MVGLAKELEGQPFHFIASHNQGGDGDAALHEIFANGLSPFTPNVTVAKHANHPGIKGTGYVPYYMVFDHHGDLAYHHMGGPYHGGDGTAVLDRVRTMLKDVPAVYAGKEPFTAYADLADEFASGKKLRRAITTLAGEAKTQADHEEILRLTAAVERHRDQVLADVNTALATDPKAAMKTLKNAAADFTDTPWSGPVDELMTALQDRDTFAAHMAAAKDLAWAVKRYKKLEPVTGNGGKALNPRDAEFRRANAKPLSKIVDKLHGLREAHGSLPAGRRAATLLQLLGH